MTRTKRRKALKGVSGARKACTRKQRYGTELMAELERQRLGLGRKYRCHFCNGWHLAK